MRPKKIKPFITVQLGTDHPLHGCATSLLEGIRGKITKHIQLDNSEVAEARIDLHPDQLKGIREGLGGIVHTGPGLILEYGKDVNDGPDSKQRFVWDGLRWIAVDKASY